MFEIPIPPGVLIAPTNAERDAVVLEKVVGGAILKFPDPNSSKSVPLYLILFEVFHCKNVFTGRVTDPLDSVVRRIFPEVDVTLKSVSLLFRVLVPDELRCKLTFVGTLILVPAG